MPTSNAVPRPHAFIQTRPWLVVAAQRTPRSTSTTSWSSASLPYPRAASASSPSTSAFSAAASPAPSVEGWPSSGVDDAGGVVGAVGVRVEVQRSGVAGALQQPHEQERLLEVFGAEAEVLVVAPDALRVEVDVKQLARPQRLADAVVKRQAGHRLVGDLRVDADHLRPRQRGDEVQGVTHGRQEDVAARLVGLGLQREAQVVALRDDVVGEDVDRLAVAVQRVARVLGDTGLRALAPAPEDVDLGTKL